MTRYLVLPTLLVFALGLGAGWALHRPYYQVVNDHGAALTVLPTWTPPPGVTCVDARDGAPVRAHCDDYGPCVREDVYEPASETSSATWTVRFYCPTRPPNWAPFPCGEGTGQVCYCNGIPCP